MPALNLPSRGLDLAKDRFRSFSITLPAIPSHSTPIRGTFKPITGKATGGIAMQSVQSARSFAGGGQHFESTPPPAGSPMAFPPALFRAASNSPQDIDYQSSMHQTYNNLIESILQAIEHGFSQYRLQAGLRGVTVYGPIATGGRLDGPPLDNFISSAPSVGGWSGWLGEARDAVAKGLQVQWKEFSNSVSVPGLFWYPKFAAVAGSKSPLVANIPARFSALRQNSSLHSPEKLKAQMRAALKGQMDFANEFFDAISTAFDAALTVWKTLQMVTNVQAHGPIPSFAPPYVPVGPVVMGDNIAGPHFLQ